MYRPEERRPTVTSDIVVHVRVHPDPYVDTRVLSTHRGSVRTSRAVECAGDGGTSGTRVDTQKVVLHRFMFGIRLDAVECL